MLEFNFLLTQRWVVESKTVPLGHVWHFILKKSKNDDLGHPMQAVPLKNGAEDGQVSISSDREGKGPI